MEQTAQACAQSCCAVLQPPRAPVELIKVYRTRIGNEIVVVQCSPHQVDSALCGRGLSHVDAVKKALALAQCEPAAVQNPIHSGGYIKFSVHNC